MYGNATRLLLTDRQVALLESLILKFRENRLFLGFPVIREIIDGREIVANDATFVDDLKRFLAGYKPKEFCRSCGGEMMIQ